MSTQTDDSRFVFSSIAEIVAHVQGQFKHMTWIGKDYSIADLSRDLTEIDRINEESATAMVAELTRAETQNERLTALKERKIPTAEMTDAELIDQLRSHVRSRLDATGKPYVKNGAWELMLQAADRIENAKC